MGKTFRFRIWTETGGSSWKQSYNLVIICQVDGKGAQPIAEIN